MKPAFDPPSPEGSTWPSLTGDGHVSRPALLRPFSGAGGLDLGFEQAGFIPLLALDRDCDAVATYNYNRGPRRPSGKQ